MPRADDPPPQRPPEPDPAECCGEGCANCVYDLHEAALLRYEREMEEWRARQQRT
ncbi:MAG TPA: oxidoreductase-like domain-containing protein [Pseudoxanthomonas sp.]